MTAEVNFVFYDVLTCVRTLAPIASQARHFPPRAGEADAKEKRNYSFKMYYLLVVLKRKNTKRKPSPNTGKVSTIRLTKGVSWSRQIRIEINISRNERIHFEEWRCLFDCILI